MRDSVMRDVRCEPKRQQAKEASRVLNTGTPMTSSLLFWLKRGRFTTMRWTHARLQERGAAAAPPPPAPRASSANKSRAASGLTGRQRRLPRCSYGAKPVRLLPCARAASPPGEEGGEREARHPSLTSSSPAALKPASTSLSTRAQGLHASRISCHDLSCWRVLQHRLRRTVTSGGAKSCALPRACRLRPLCARPPPPRRLSSCFLPAASASRLLAQA